MNNPFTDAERCVDNGTYTLSEAKRFWYGWTEKPDATLHKGYWTVYFREIIRRMEEQERITFRQLTDWRMPVFGEEDE